MIRDSSYLVRRFQLNISRMVWILAGHVFLFLGILGAFLPILPTTPFLLLAAFCYSKGSEKFHAWLIQHPRWGPVIDRWQRYKQIPLRAKIISTILITGNGIYICFFLTISWKVKILVGLILSGALTFILTRPHKLNQPLDPD